MKINTSKTKSMVISTAQADRSWDPEVTADGDKIKPVPDYPFLGVSIGNNLRFKKHIDKMVDKGKKTVNVIKCLSSKKWGNSLETQRQIYTQYVRSGLEYASPSWDAWISKTDRERLQRVQNDALRSAAGLAMTCPTDFLHLETGVEPINIRLEKNSQVLWERYERLEEDDPRKIMIKKETPPPRLKSRRGFRYETGKRMNDMEIHREIQAKPVPPWYEIGIIFERVELEKKKESYSNEELRTRAMEKIASLAFQVTIYTDGSTDGKQENGGVATIPFRRVASRLQPAVTLTNPVKWDGTRNRQLCTTGALVQKRTQPVSPPPKLQSVSSKPQPKLKPLEDSCRNVQIRSQSNRLQILI